MSVEMSRIGPTTPLISWDGTGAFDGAYDDGSADLSRTGPMVIEIGRDQARALGRPRANLASWRYRNQDRTYSSENVASPLQGSLLPGRPTRIEKTIGDATITMADALATMADEQVLMSGVSTARLFTGTADEPVEEYGPGPNRRYVAMQALGSLAKLLAVTTVSVALQTTITVGAAMVLLLTAAGLAADEYEIDQEAIDNGRILDWWYVDARAPFEVAIELWASTGPTAALYEDQYGRLIFEGDTYLFLTERCNTTQATYYANRDDGLWFTRLQVVPGAKQIVNDVRFRMEQRATQATTQVAELGASFDLAAAEAKTVIFRAEDPLVAHTTPVLTTDYTVTGTALASVTSTALGPKAVAVTFTAGAGAATVGPRAGGTGPRLRGEPLTVVGTVDVEPTVDASDSQAAYGVRSLPSSIAPWPGLRPSEAAGVADAWVTTYQDNRPSFEITLVNSTGLLLREILARRVSDLIEVVDLYESGAVRQLTIHQIRHEITSDHEHRVTFGCEARIDQSLWGQYDVALYDVASYGQ